MKQILLSITILLFFISSTFAQISITDFSGLDLTNTSSSLPLDVDYHFQITNNGSSDITFIVEVTAFSLPEDNTTIIVCAANSCFQITSVPSTVGVPVFLEAGDTYGEEGNQDGEAADVHYTSNGNTGQATITINIYEEGNPSNSSEITLETDIVGVNNISENEISIYPNPAKNTINISNNNYDEIIFSNIAGQIVKRISNSQTTISTSEFSNGIYFYQVVKNNAVIKTDKIIVRK